MTFLDFWSTSSALYGPDEGLKYAGTVFASFKPLFGPYRALVDRPKSSFQACQRMARYHDYVRLFSSAAETLKKRLCHTSDTPQKHSGSRPHLHLYAFSHRGEFHGQ
jgi:hypothetical protein